MHASKSGYEDYHFTELPLRYISITPTLGCKFVIQLFPKLTLNLIESASGLADLATEIHRNIRITVYTYYKQNSQIFY